MSKKEKERIKKEIKLNKQFNSLLQKAKNSLHRNLFEDSKSYLRKAKGFNLNRQQELKRFENEINTKEEVYKLRVSDF